jgi:hypothetical protein
MSNETTIAEKDTESSEAVDSTSPEQSFTVVLLTYDKTFTRETYTNVTRMFRGPSSTVTLEYVSGEEERIGSVFQFEVSFDEGDR